VKNKEWEDAAGDAAKEVSFFVNHFYMHAKKDAQKTRT